MTIPMPLLVAIIGILATAFSTAIWSFAKKTNKVIERNTEAYNQLSIIVAEMRTKDVGHVQLCNNKHKTLDKTVERHETMLEMHGKEIMELKLTRK